LTAQSERRVRLIVPKRGEKRGLLDLAARNAELAYQARFNENVAANYDALETLRVVLGLPSIPRRIECFDISTIQGSETVASMVVCEDGRMRRSEYRKFRIKGTTDPAALPAAPDARVLDDFKSMHEVVLRRYRKLLEAGGPFPDLILIDGGKGQLSSAYAALEQLGLANLVAVGIAKKEELLFTRDRQDPIALTADGPPLPQDPAHDVWQPGRCPPGHPRGTGPRGRGQVRRCRAGAFRDPGVLAGRTHKFLINQQFCRNLERS
jgi:excinuclease ABC subunit C